MGNNVTVLTDPHDGVSMGLPVPVSEPDIVLVSHDHEDHANGVKLFNQSKVLDFPCMTAVKGAKITGIKGYHDDVEGERLGENIFFRFIVDGLFFGHTGDMGHILSTEQLSEIGAVDILFAGINETAQKNTELIKPKVVIPMHYHVDGIIFPWFKMPDVSDYVKGKEHMILSKDTHIYTMDNLPSERSIHVYQIR